MDIELHNTKALLGGAIAEFRFAEGTSTLAAALAAGYDTLGNLTGLTLQSNSTTKTHKGAYRTGRRIDKTIIIDSDCVYQMKFDEVGSKNLRYSLFSDKATKTTQTARSAATADALTSPAINKWYPLLISGVPVRKASIVAITSTPSVVENVDYVVDYDTVAIRWITTPPGTITSIAITAPAIVSTDANSYNRLTPHGKQVKRGMAQVLIYDRDELTNAPSLAYLHDGFYAELYPEGNPNLAQEDFAELTLNARIGSIVGNVDVREA